jgi:hypothetical protein
MRAPRAQQESRLWLLSVVLVLVTMGAGRALAQNASETGGGNRAPAGGSGPSFSPLLRSWNAGPGEYGGRAHHGSASGHHGGSAGHGRPSKSGSHHPSHAASHPPDSH